MTAETMEFTDLRAFRFLMGAACLAVGLAGAGCDGPPPPEAPTGLEGVSKDGAIALEWSAVQAENLTGYNVYRSTSSFVRPGEARKVNESLTESPSYSDGGVENGTTYHYRVTAVVEAEGFLGIGGGTEESAPSGKVEKTPFAEPPDRP